MRTSLPLVSASLATGVATAAPDGGDLDERVHRLTQRLSALDGLVVAFSGGVDSSVLLAEAFAVLGERCVAATAVSPSLAPSELDTARQVARSLGVDHVEVETFEGERPDYIVNNRDRCYVCKSELFDRLAPLLDRFGAIAVGTIVDDLGQHRPGQRAAAERDVLTPLADAGMTKADVRALAQRRGLPTADAPAQACLASRVAYGLEVTPERLHRIAAAEAWLDARGFAVRRVRDHGDRARVEVAIDQIPRLGALAGALDEHLRGLGWHEVEIDPLGHRSGSMDEVSH